MRAVRLAVAVAIAAMVTGCGAEGITADELAKSQAAAYTSGMAAQRSLDREEAEESASREEAAAAAASRSAAAAASSAAAALHAPGETVTDAIGHTVTYYSMQRPAATSAPDPQDPATEWVAIDVQVCYGPGAKDFDNTHSWVLVDAGNGNYDPSSVGYSQFPSPKFPSGDLTVVDGQCIRGWIVYPVVIGTPVVNVAYLPYGADRPVVWTA